MNTASTAPTAPPGGGLPVHVVELMDGVDGQHHLPDVEPRHVLREPVFELAEQGQQVAAHVVVHDQVLEGGRDGQRTQG